VLFANLLPGLRELRAPLAAGYMLLVAAWMLAIGAFPVEKEATGIAATLYHVKAVIGSAGLVAAISFVAYLTGSIVADAASAGYRGVSTLLRRADPPDPKPPRPGLRRGDRPVLVSVGPTGYIGPRGVEGLSEFTDRTWRDLEGPVPDLERVQRLTTCAYAAFGPESRESVKLGLVDLIAYVAEAVDQERVGRAGEKFELSPWVRNRVSAQLTLRTIAELDLVQTRLLGSEQELHGAADRLRAEAELRLALALPLMLLGIAFVVRGPWWAAVLSLAAVPAFTFQAVRRNRQAGDLLADAISIERVKAPTLERFQRLATGAGAPLAEVANRPDPTKTM
jgi:hypothetical protein